MNSFGMVTCLFRVIFLSMTLCPLIAFLLKYDLINIVFSLLNVKLNGVSYRVIIFMKKHKGKYSSLNWVSNGVNVI